MNEVEQALFTGNKEEFCQRCGEPGPDLRTLWMSCLYNMAELPIPFNQKALEVSGEREMLGEKDVMLIKQKLKVPDWSDVKAYEKPDQRNFFTLRVCKDCRGEWMGAIQHWFSNAPGKKDIIGSGIFVRRNGATIEISEEEWYRDNPDREPVRVKNAEA